MSAHDDVVIVGGGHNALTAAAHLARARKRVVVLERQDRVGGAAVSEQPWAGVDARLSRYSYLVSLLPRTIIDDLDLRLDLRRRRYSSYTPDPADPSRGILIDNADAAATTASVIRTTGDLREAERFEAFTDRLLPLAATVFPSVTEPLRRASEMRAEVADTALWDALTTRPLGGLLRDGLGTDIARGIALTDGLIGTFSRADDPSLRQNRCFLYHVIGGGTGDWDVPVGGMGRVSAALENAARRAGAEIRVNATVSAVVPGGSPCIEARTMTDLEGSLGMTAGDIFHGPLSWPWAGDDEPFESAPSVGAWRRRTNGYCCAGRARVAAAPSAASAGTTPRWRRWSCSTDAQLCGGSGGAGG